jgi:glycosyltransferase involved in cell wall biosynthesis
MKVSVVVTTFNEEESILKLLVSLLVQTHKPDEIVVVDSESSDKTTDLIKEFETENSNITLLSKKCTRGEGRNIGIENANNEAIAMTDAGCVADTNWLERITKPLEKDNIDVVAGFYKMTTTSPFQKAAAVFLGILPSQFDDNYLPSTRSIAFTKSIWKKVGGFPNLNTAEDTVFNFKLINGGVGIKRVKSARVEWRIPSDLSQVLKKMFNYAKGDAESKLWKYNDNSYTSHNIKVLLIYIRYILGILFLIFSTANPLFMNVLILSLIIYCLWSFWKVYNYKREVRAGLWGIVLQITSDLTVMSGFIIGTIKHGLL